MHIVNTVCLQIQQQAYCTIRRDSRSSQRLVTDAFILEICFLASSSVELTLVELLNDFSLYGQFSNLPSFLDRVIYSF